MQLREFRHRRGPGFEILYGYDPATGMFIISGQDGPEAKGHPNIPLHDGSKYLVDDEGRTVRPLAEGEDEQEALHPAAAAAHQPPPASVPAGAAPRHPEEEVSFRGLGSTAKSYPSKEQELHESGKKDAESGSHQAPVGPDPKGKKG